MTGISAPVLSLTVGEAMADGWMAQDAEVAQHLRSFELSTIHDAISGRESVEVGFGGPWVSVFLSLRKTVSQL